MDGYASRHLASLSSLSILLNPMIAIDFNYSAPTTLEEALLLLDTSNHAVILSGGYSLVSLLKSKGISPDLVIDTKLIPGLDTIEAGPKSALHVGSSVSLARLLDNSLLISGYPAIIEALDLVHDRQQLNQTSIGDEYFYDTTGRGLLSALYAYDAQFIYKSRGHIATLSHLLPPQSKMLLTSIVLPGVPSTVRFNQITNPVTRTPLFGVTTSLEVNDGLVLDSRILLFGENIPVSRAVELENLMLNSSIEVLPSLEFSESLVAGYTENSMCSKKYLVNLLKTFVLRATA